MTFKDRTPLSFLEICSTYPIYYLPTLSACCNSRKKNTKMIRIGSYTNNLIHKLSGHRSQNSFADFSSLFQKRQTSQYRTLKPLPEDLEPAVSHKALQAFQHKASKFNELIARAHAGGGPRGIERHVNKNRKLLVRDRIKLLLDPGTNFLELGSLVGFDLPYADVPVGGMVGGIGKVNGIYCLISGNDATVKAGTFYPITVQKGLRLQEIASLNRLPYICIPDSGGAFLPLQSLIFINGGRSFYNQAVMSSKGIPQIAVVCGSCTAGAAYNPTMCDEAIIVDRIGKLFLGGPPLVQMALGETTTEEELGGAFLHSSVSGCTDYYASTEHEAFQMCRDSVEEFNYEAGPIPTSHNQPSYELPSWNHMASREHLNKAEVYAILGAILDGSQLKEFKPFYGIGLIAGFGSIEGSKIGIIVNCDYIGSNEALKATHFLNLCDRRGIPVLFLQNSATISDTIDQNNPSVLRDRGKLSSTVATISVPKVSLTMTSCHEDDLLVMCGPSFNPTFSYAWPSARISNLDLGEVAGNSEEDGILDAFVAGSNMLIDEIILPDMTRRIIGETLRIMAQIKYNKSKWLSRNDPVLRM